MTILEMAIGWLAPPSCVGCEAEGSSLCLACSSSEILSFGERCFGCNSLSVRSKTCKTCRAKHAPNHVWVSTDHEGLAKVLIQKFKFAHQRAAASQLVDIMSNTFLDQNSDQQIRLKNYLVVSIPTASRRTRQRGFDHTSLLAQRLSRQLGVEMAMAVGRLGQNQQVGANRSVRTAQAQEAYFIKRSTLVKGRNILLIDDVVTTGATLSAVAKILRATGARSVDALVFAKHL